MLATWENCDRFRIRRVSVNWRKGGYFVACGGWMCNRVFSEECCSINPGTPLQGTT